MKKYHYVGMMAAFAALSSVPAYAKDSKHIQSVYDGLSPMTNHFITGADMGGRFEVDSSKIALERSHSKKVRAFAKTMIDDHEQAAADMKSVVPANAPQTGTLYDKKHKAMLSELRTAPAADFDGLYIADQKKAHEEAIALFTSYAKNGDDAKLKEFAQNTLPTLKEHKEHLMGFKKGAYGANVAATTADGYKAHTNGYRIRTSRPIIDTTNPGTAILNKSEDSPSRTLRP